MRLVAWTAASHNRRRLRAAPVLTPVPRVSVVIPSRNRPALVCRAVSSALGQSFADLEVVVVLDGPDPAAAEALASIDDPRLRVIALDAPAGNAEARNAGVKEARAPWVAFLDDDDEWMPSKIEIQMRSACASRLRFPIVSCRLLARNGEATFVWPRRTPRPGEHVSEYLFCRTSPYWGEGDVNTNTLLTARDLLTAVPFRSGLRRYVENDWLLRATLVDGAGIEFVDTEEPLAIWNIDDDRPRLTSAPDWRESLAWMRGNRDLVTARAYAAFLLADVGVAAARRHEWAAFVPLMLEAFANGRPGWFDFALLAASCVIPARVRRRLARNFAARRRRERDRRRLFSRLLYWPVCRFYARHVLEDAPADAVYRWLCSFQYWRIYRSWPRFARPRLFSEKIWSRMLHDRNPLLPVVSDKLRARDYVAQKIGASHLIPLLWSGDDPEQIPFDHLPSAFVIKATHGCGYNIIVTDKSRLDRRAAKTQLRKWLRQNYCKDVLLGAEWAYRSVKPSIIVEAFVGDGPKVPVDFKFYCFAGRVEFLMLHHDRFGNQTTKAFDRNFEPADISFHYQSRNGRCEPPPRFDLMVSLAESLAEDFDFMRVDLYSDGDNVYFSELTPYPGGVDAKFFPASQDAAIGEKWKTS